jgi:hypothetical protein
MYVCNFLDHFLILYNLNGHPNKKLRFPKQCQVLFEKWYRGLFENLSLPGVGFDSCQKNAQREDVAFGMENALAVGGLVSHYS